jgi:hypothetical protein
MAYRITHKNKHKNLPRLLRWQTCFGMLVLLALLGIGASSVISSCEPLPSSVQKPSAMPSLSLETVDTPEGRWLSVQVPNGVNRNNTRFVVLPAQAKQLALLEDSAWQTAYSRPPILILNGGFFDPVNGQPISHLFQSGSWVGNPAKNKRLVGNPRLQNYLPQIMNRTEFRTYECSPLNGEQRIKQLQYDIALHQAPIPGNCHLMAALGAGPSLLPLLSDQPEGFTAYDPQGKKIRDAIGIEAKNARSAVGITKNGDVIFVLASQMPGKRGMSLPAVAEFMKQKGAVTAMALDGGSSSALWMDGKTTYGKLDASGTLVKRPVKSVLMVLPR